MFVRFRKFLTILLLLAAASPPPRISNSLISDAPHRESGEFRKPVQARGRHRIGSLVQMDQLHRIAPLSSGEARTSPRSRFLKRHRDHPPRLVEPTSHFPTEPTTLRLRC